MVSAIADKLNQKKLLAIIPARAGSKRLPGKNSKVLHKKPLIQWTIEAALQCELLTDVIVSTDSETIAQISSDCGLPVPFIRPAHCSGDKATAIDVVKHAVEFMQSKGINYDYIVWLQPTSPLRTHEDISSAIMALFEKNAEAIISVCECDHSPLWSNTLDENRSMDNFLTDFLKNNPRSQALPDYFRLNGAIYIANTKRLIEEGSFFLADNVFAHVMDKEASIDIDSHLDFKLADLLLAEKMKEQHDNKVDKTG